MTELDYDFRPMTAVQSEAQSEKAVGRLYVDMDGTLCRFHDADHKYIESMWQEGFYTNLEPFQNLVDALNIMLENPDNNIYVLSAILDTEPPFVEQEKREWLHKFLPKLPDDHMIFVPAGADKSNYIPDLAKSDILLDDYNKNLREWEQGGGTAVKFVNDVNNKGLGAYGGEKGLLWQGQKVIHIGFPTSIAAELTACLSQPEGVTQKVPEHKADNSVCKR